MAESSEYEFVGLYADSGISGRSMRKRPQLLRLLEDAKEKRFDVVFTKSVARFARNTEELLSMVRELRDEGIKVIFEKEKIDTFNPKQRSVSNNRSISGRKRLKNILAEPNLGYARKV